MQIKNISFNSQNFKGDKRSDNKTKNKNFTLGALTYATIFAIYPHNYEKIADTLGANFKSLPLKDKIKNVSKASIPFFGCPLLVMAWLKIAVNLIKTHKNKKFKEHNSENSKY